MAHFRKNAVAKRYKRERENRLKKIKEEIEKVEARLKKYDNDSTNLDGSKEYLSFLKDSLEKLK